MVTVCVLMTAFAVSPKITFGRYVLADLSGPWSAPLATFRSSGRFFWPLAYLTLTWAAVTVATRLSRPVAVAAMTAAVLVQAADLHAVHENRRQAARDPAFYAWTNPFVSDRWTSLATGYAHLALTPPPQCGPAPLPYEPAVRLAAEHGLTVNAGVIARGDDSARRRYCDDFAAEIDAGRLRDDTLYLVSAAEADTLQGAGRVTCGVIDAVWVCTTADAHARWPPAVAFDP